MKPIFYFLFLAFYLNIDTLSAQCVSNPNSIFSFIVNQKSYELVKENKSWQAARSCALSRGGNLAIINSQMEQDSIFANLNRAGIITNNTTAPDGGGAAYVWLSGNDIASEGSWVWDTTGTNNPQFWQGARTGNPVGGRYNNWGNEPDNYFNQDALGIALTSWPYGVAGEWNDIDTGNTLYFLIEYSGIVGIEEQSKTDKFKVYPNPVSDWLFLECDCLINNELKVSIIDIRGSLVAVEYIKQPKIDLSTLKGGVYWLFIEESNSLIKIIKQ